MTDTSKHTSTPWRIGNAGLTVFGPPNGNPSPVTVAHTTRANAAYIVQCVNSHATLVNTLERIIQYRDRVGALGFQLEKLDSYIDDARASLAQVRA